MFVDIQNLAIKTYIRNSRYCYFEQDMVLFLVINIGIINSVSVILKKIKFIVIPIYLHCCNIPKGILNIVPIVSKLAVTSISLKLQ